MLTAIGALLIGVGAVSVWITVGIPNESAHTSIVGTDQTDGRVVLVCAVLILVVVVASRVVRSRRARELLAGIALISAAVALVIATAFIADGKDRNAVLEALGIPRTMWAELGVFRDLGPGAYVVLAGGVLCIAGALLTLRWAQRTKGRGSSAA